MTRHWKEFGGLSLSRPEGPGEGSWAHCLSVRPAFPNAMNETLVKALDSLNIRKERIEDAGWKQMDV